MGNKISILPLSNSNTDASSGDAYKTTANKFAMTILEVLTLGYL